RAVHLAVGLEQRVEVGRGYQRRERHHLDVVAGLEHLEAARPHAGGHDETLAVGGHAASSPYAIFWRSVADYARRRIAWPHTARARALRQDPRPRHRRESGDPVNTGLALPAPAVDTGCPLPRA